MTTVERLTPVERGLYAMLSDGELHSAKALKSTWDAMAEDNALHIHIHNLRRKIAPNGQGIATLPNGQTFYQIVRLISK